MNISFNPMNICINPISTENLHDIILSLHPDYKWEGPIISDIV